MKVGINLLGFEPGYTGGVNTYTLGLLGGFAALADHNFTYNLYVTETNCDFLSGFKAYANFNLVIVKDFDSMLKRRITWRTKMWDLYGLHVWLSNLLYKKVSRKIDAENDLVYFPCTVIFPYNYKIPVVLSMHDIQQVHYPEFFTEVEKKDRKISYEASVNNLNYLQASSEFMIDDFLAHFKNLKREQVFKITEGVTIGDFSSSKETGYLNEKYAIPEEFIYYPAQLWHHKNHITILKALLVLKQESKLEIPLVLTGAKYSAADAIFEFIEKNDLKNVYYLGKVPYADLLALYKKAKYMITAVLYESSSLPVLEAASSGTAIIASATPPNVEMSKNLDMNLFEPLDVKALKDLLLKIWNDTDLIAKQVARNQENIHMYSWENVASQYQTFFPTVKNK